MHHAVIFGNGSIKDYKKIGNLINQSFRPSSGKTLFHEHSAHEWRVEEQQKRKPLTSSGKKALFDIIICADGGARHAVKLNLVPNAVIGDLDSIAPAIRKKFENNPDIKWIEHPTAKDQTDSQLAIDYAIKQKCQSLTLCGFTGGRTDHFLATLFYLASQPIAKVKILSEQETMYMMSRELVLKGERGQLFSLIPLFGDVNGITLTGAKFGLKNETLKYGSTRGVSNKFANKTLSLTCKQSSPLLVIVQN